MAGATISEFCRRYMRSGMDQKPFEVLTGRFVNTWDFTVRPSGANAL